MTRNERTRRLTDGKRLTDGPNISSKKRLVFPNISQVSFACVVLVFWTPGLDFFKVPFPDSCDTQTCWFLCTISKNPEEAREGGIYIYFRQSGRWTKKKRGAAPAARNAPPTPASGVSWPRAWESCDPRLMQGPPGVTVRVEGRASGRLVHGFLWARARGVMVALFGASMFAVAAIGRRDNGSILGEHLMTAVQGPSGDLWRTMA